MKNEYVIEDDVYCSISTRINGTHITTVNEQHRYNYGKTNNFRRKIFKYVLGVLWYNNGLHQYMYEILTEYIKNIWNCIDISHFNDAEVTLNHLVLRPENASLAQIAKILGSDAKVSDRYLLDIDPRVLAIWETNEDVVQQQRCKYHYISSNRISTQIVNINI